MGSNSIKELDYLKEQIDTRSGYGASIVSTWDSSNYYLWWSAISNSDLFVPAHHISTMHLSPINMFGWYDKILYQIYIYAENIEESTSDSDGNSTESFTTNWQVDAGCGLYSDDYIANRPGQQPKNGALSSAISSLLGDYWASTGKLDIKYGPSGHKYFAYLIDRTA